MFQTKNSSSVLANNLFEGTDKNLKFNISQKDFVEKKEGDIIFQSGDKSDYMYLLIEGEVKVKITGVFSNPVIVRHGKNEFFGEKELVEKTKRTSSAVANTHCLLYRIDYNTIEKLSDKSRILKKNLYKSLNIDESEEPSPVEGQKQFFIKTEDSTKKFTISSKTEKEEKKEKPEIPSEVTEEIPEELRDITEEAEDKEPGVETASDETFEDASTGEELEIIEPELQDENIEITEEAGFNDEEAIIYVEPDEEEQPPVIHEEPAAIKEETPEDTEEHLEWDFTLGIFDEPEEQSGEPQITEKQPEEEVTPADYVNIPEQNPENFIEEKQEDIPAEPEEDSISFQNFTEHEIGPEIPPEEAVMSGIGAFSLEDLTEPEIKEEKKGLTLEEKNDLLKQFSGLVVSDIKYPVSTLKFYAEQIKKRGISYELNEVVDLLIEQADIIAGTTEALNDFAANKNTMSVEAVTINAALDEILGILADYIESMGSKLFKKYETTALVNIDRGKIYQALYQLTKNACEAMPGGGNIYITSTSDGDNVKISVKNKGKSIPLEMREKIFEPYVSYDKENAAGLGLSIALKIIRDHNGNIEIEEDEDGISFVISLPIAR